MWGSRAQLQYVPESQLMRPQESCRLSHSRSGLTLKAALWVCSANEKFHVGVVTLQTRIWVKLKYILIGKIATCLIALFTT